MSVDCVILQFTSDTDNIIMSLMSPRLALAQPFPSFFPFFLLPLMPLSVSSPSLVRDPPVTSCSERSQEDGTRGLSLRRPPTLKGLFVASKVLLFFPFSICVCGASTANITQASNSHACDLTPLAANVFSGSRAGMVQGGWKFQSPLYHFPYHYFIRSHFSPS